jgi:hypothetical protein
VGGDGAHGTEVVAGCNHDTEIKNNKMGGNGMRPTHENDENESRKNMLRANGMKI